MSIRLRLTLLYSGILALTLIAFGVALYFTVSRVTLAVVEETLASEAQRVVSAPEFKLDYIHYKAGRFSDPPIYVQTVGLDGQVVARTSNLGDYVLPLSPAGWTNCRKGDAWTETISTGEGRLVVYSKPVWDQGKVDGVVQVAQSLVEYDQSLNTLKGILFSGGLLATVSSFGLGWALSGAALRPINRITHTAEAIGAERDFDRRVQYTGPNDEIGRLSTTFNAMLHELSSGYRQVEQALHAQRRFVADASHELRTPLTTIRGNLGLLERVPPIGAEDREAVIADTVEECDRLIRLINSLLVLARADSGLVLRQEAVPIKPFVDDLCRQAQLLAAERRIQCLNTLEVVATADRDALKQVLLILLDNAIKYTPPRGVITISTAASRGRISVQVRDTGRGIPPEAVPHIFERFYRVEAARTSAGAGLGLAIAKELVEAQGGTLEVESEPGQGSAFTLTLPEAAPSGLLPEPEHEPGD
jgi:two-component system, OmpR family, sensor kinase